jgi:hypothetical protein
MTEKRSQRAQAKDHMAAALDRWEGEGGAQVLPWALSYEGYDPARLRAQIARFLHNHKDDADTP